jgi:rhodanese-related sulfurtransferase
MHRPERPDAEARPRRASGTLLDGMSEIDRLLADARRSLRRLDPTDVPAAMSEGALLVDTRPLDQRRRDGEIPGALVVDRNVLEWRMDPTSPHRLQEIGDRDQTVIVICHEGFSSSLAAATLQRLGLRNATDVVGGFAAWTSVGLPVKPHADQGGAPDMTEGLT